MIARKPFFVYIILIVFGIVLLLNVGGIVIEFLFGVGVLNYEGVNISKIYPISLVLYLGFIFGCFLFLFYLMKNKKKCIFYWHIFTGFGFLIVFYKVFNPTYLSLVVPFYFVIAFGITVLIWLLMFKYLTFLKNKRGLI